MRTITREMNPVREDPSITPLGSLEPGRIYPYNLIATRTGHPDELDTRFINPQYLRMSDGKNVGLRVLALSMDSDFAFCHSKGYPSTSWLHNPGGVDLGQFYDFDQMRLCLADVTGDKVTSSYAETFRTELRGTVGTADVRPVAYLGCPAENLDYLLYMEDFPAAPTTQYLRECLGPVQDFQWSFDHMGQGWHVSLGDDFHLHELARITHRQTHQPMLVEGRTLYSNKTSIELYLRGLAAPVLMARDLQPTELHPYSEEQAPGLLRQLGGNINAIMNGQDTLISGKALDLPSLALLLRASGKHLRPYVLVTDVPPDMAYASDDVKQEWRRSRVESLLPWCHVIASRTTLETLPPAPYPAP